MRVSFKSLLIPSPELKKEEWSVYVLDQSASERKFSGNGTIKSVLKDEEAVPIVGKVKKKFRKELLDIELRLVKVLLFSRTRVDFRCPYLQPRISPHYHSNKYSAQHCNNAPSMPCSHPPPPSSHNDPPLSSLHVVSSPPSSNKTPLPPHLPSLPLQIPFGQTLISHKTSPPSSMITRTNPPTYPSNGTNHTTQASTTISLQNKSTLHLFHVHRHRLHRFHRHHHRENLPRLRWR